MPGRGSRIVFLGDSCVDAIPAHELLHVLGRYHEQARPDRDQYVVIHSQNFDSSKSHVATNSLLLIMIACMHGQANFYARYDY